MGEILMILRGAMAAHLPMLQSDRMSILPEEITHA